MNFDSKNILVIGGSSGIGRGIAKCFSEKGADVCITGTKDSIDQYEEDLDEVTKSCHNRALDLSRQQPIILDAEMGVEPIVSSL